MRKKIILLMVLSFLLLFVPSEASAEQLDIAEIEDRINSIAHYAEEYEIGNINYFQFVVYNHKIEADLNLMLGGSIGEEWGRIPKENVESTFGTPTDYTNWIWLENKHRDKRTEESMPWWERIVFDGRKVRIIFHAFPSAIEGEDGTLSKFYCVSLDAKFKSEFDFDMDAILDDMTSLVAEYNLTRTRKSGEDVVRKMLEYQNLLGAYVQENLEQCTDTMESLFKPENTWPKEKMMMWEFSLYGGYDFDLMAHFGMCEDCDWHYLYMDFWVEGMGPAIIFQSPELHYGKLDQQVDEEYYWSLTIDGLNQELSEAIFEMRDGAEKYASTMSEDFPKKFFFNRFKVQQINRILDGKYNEVHRFDSSIAGRIESGELQGPGGCKDLEGCRRYCENMDNEEECRAFTYGLRVETLEQMFAGYDIERTPVDKSLWEIRLFENYQTRQDSWCRHVDDFQCSDEEGCVDGECVPALGGDETCDNMEDDDGDGVVDCQDPDCWEERHCGKLCEDICGKEGGCWETSHELCSGVCEECWECGGDEDCRSVCEPECWSCHDQEEVQSACDECRTCEDEAYGGCYGECKSCEECNNLRMEKIDAIFARAVAGEIETPGGCMTMDDCNRYCAEHSEECWGIMEEIGLYSEELDCNEDCKDCTVCNYDLGNFKCNENQNFERESGYCVCYEGWYDCDGDWENGCEATAPCGFGRCFEECGECDACGEGEEGEECRAQYCLECHKCRNPDMPTYICDGVEQLEPCKTEYICNGVKQKKPCEIYICDGKEYPKPCDEANITCGKNQILIEVENKCACKEGFKDCDSDGDCEPTKSCGLEICDDSQDNDDDGFVDCQDPNCNRQVCGLEGDKELLCIGKKCIPPEEETPPEDPEPICGNHICERNESVEESNEHCPEDCVVCVVYDPPECPNGKIVWGGKDKFGCHLPPICVVTEKVCEVDEDCPKPKCGVSRCIENECKITELTTECEEGCKEGKTRKRKCKDGSEIITAVCSANEWVETGNDCPEKKCQPILCTLYCEYGYKKDSQGCEICECNPPPETTTTTIEGATTTTTSRETTTTTELYCPTMLTCDPEDPCFSGWELCGGEGEETTTTTLPGETTTTLPEETTTTLPVETTTTITTTTITTTTLPLETTTTLPTETTTTTTTMPETAPPEEEEEIAPEVEEEELEVCSDCVLANDCGGPQDVCSNGNCVTLPIPVERGKPESPPGKPAGTPGGPPETPPGQQEAQPQQESAPPEEPAPVSEEPAPAPEPEIPTGNIVVRYADYVAGRFAQALRDFTGLFAEEKRPCEEDCRPCDDCYQNLDRAMKRIESGEMSGPNGCGSRGECEEYCYRDENRKGCDDFFKGQGVETFFCWEDLCRECDKCRYAAGELECKANQHFKMEEGFCECNEGWHECDGDWETGCEAPQRCEGCQSKEDCAEDRCAPWGNVIQQFDCFQGEQWTDQVGAFVITGECSFFPTKRIEGNVFFDMWGEPFEDLYPIREEMQLEIGKDWCQWELDNKIKERIELQNSLTEDSLRWFFEEYVPSSPSEWEKHIGGIFDSYWRLVDNSEKTAHNLLCLGRDKYPEEYVPIDISYDTDFGAVRIWEVEKTTDFYGKRTKILSTYMQIWVFPSKEFLKQELQEAMDTGLMPGPDGPKEPEMTPSEIEELKKDKKFMKIIESISEKYGGEARFLFNIVDNDNGEVVFNALVTVNPDILIRFEPMEEYDGAYDAKITFDFDFFYSLISVTEKDIRGGHIEYPPWERDQFRIKDVIKGATEGARMWLMINSGRLSGKIRAEPADALQDGMTIMRFMFEGGQGQAQQAQQGQQEQQQQTK